MLKHDLVRTDGPEMDKSYINNSDVMTQKVYNLFSCCWKILTEHKNYEKQ